MGHDFQPPALPDQSDTGTGRGAIPLRSVWATIGCGVAAGAGITLFFSLTGWMAHKDAVDIGMKVTLAIVGVLGVILGVRRYNLSEEEHRRQVRADDHNQRHAEALLQRQLEADQAARDDAIARQITDLSSKASEQLGSEKAAVRIGGLTDLERLAQSYPDLRQTVVDRICAYLRTPIEATAPDADVSIHITESDSEERAERARVIEPCSRCSRHSKRVQEHARVYRRE